MSAEHGPRRMQWLGSVPELEPYRSETKKIKRLKAGSDFDECGVNGIILLVVVLAVGALIYYFAAGGEIDEKNEKNTTTESPQPVEFALKNYIGYAINAASAITFDYSSGILRNNTPDPITWTQQCLFFRKTIPETHLTTLKDAQLPGRLEAFSVAEFLKNIYGVHLGSSYIDSRHKEGLWNGLLAHVSNASVPIKQVYIDIHDNRPSFVELNLENKQLWIKRTKEFVNEKLLTALDNLPNDPSELQQFLDFFDNYGTHVVVNVASGARGISIDYVFADGSFKKHCITSGGKVLLKKCDAKSLREFKKSGTNKTVGTFKYLPMWDMLKLFGDDEYEVAARNLEEVYNERYLN